MEEIRNRRKANGQSWRTKLMLSAPMWAVIATPALAQSAVEQKTTANEASTGGIADIIVTAQKREQRLQDVPVSVSALSTTELAANRIASVRDLDGVVPSLTVRSQVGGGSLPLYSMRGLVGLGSATGSDKGIAVYINGVYLGASTGSTTELADLERVEVLRGPQGTLFGRNSTGGAISFVTAEPKGEFSARQTVTVGNYDQFGSVSHFDTPTWNGLSASFNYTHSERRGEVRNLGAGTRWDFTVANGGKPKSYTSPRHLGGSNVEAIAVAVKFEPADNVKLVYRFDRSENDFSSNALAPVYVSPLVQSVYTAQPDPSILTPITRKRPDAVNADGVVPGRVTASGHALTADIQLSGNLSVKNILAYRKTRFRSPWQNIDGLGGMINTGAPIFSSLLGPTAAAATVGAPFFIIATSIDGSDVQWSNETQVNFDTDFVTMTSGFLYFHQKAAKGACCDESGNGTVRSSSMRVFPSYAVPYLEQNGSYHGRWNRVRTISYAAFSQGEFHVSDKLDLIAGVRLTHDDKKGVDNSILSNTVATIFPVDYSGSRWTYNLGANFKVDQDRLVYGKYSTGYISGGSLAGIQYQPETAKSFELGLKADWFARTLRTNLALYSVKYGNLQQATNGLALSPPNPQIVQALINVADAKAKGFELETVLRPVRGLTLTSGFGYTDFKFTRLTDIASFGAAKVLAQYRPKWTANLAAQYETEPFMNDMRMSFRLDGIFKSRSTGLTSVPASLSLTEQAAFEAAGVVPAGWLVNGRVALNDISLAGANASLSLWARNLLNSRKVQFSGGSVLVITADYERARTIGLDFSEVGR